MPSSPLSAGVDSRTVLVCAAPGPRAQALCDALGAIGQAATPVPDRPSLVQQAGALAPRLVVLDAPQGADAELLHALAPWGGEPPCSVVLVGPVAADTIAAAVAAGVTACCRSADDLAPALAEADARFARDAGLRTRLAQLQGQLEERKLLERAKGLLMQARQLPEDEAFGLLRSAAMHANLKLAEVARSVVDAARSAEAVNRAGQLRMLSQRLVALAGQRAARVAGAQARASEASRRAQDNIDFLAALELPGEQQAALAEVQQAWSALKATLAQRGPELARADAQAEALLRAAERLADALAAQGGRRVLGLVNLCGRQRMRSQRVVKEALLATLVPAAERGARLKASMDEFEQAMLEIEAAPLSSPEIRAALDGAREAWLVVLRALRASDANTLAHASEDLLERLDRLTDQVEHSLQVLLA